MGNGWMQIQPSRENEIRTSFQISKTTPCPTTSVIEGQTDEGGRRT